MPYPYNRLCSNSLLHQYKLKGKPLPIITTGIDENRYNQFE